MITMTTWSGRGAAAAVGAAMTKTPTRSARAASGTTILIHARTFERPFIGIPPQARIGGTPMRRAATPSALLSAGSPLAADTLLRGSDRSRDGQEKTCAVS